MTLLRQEPLEKRPEAKSYKEQLAAFQKAVIVQALKDSEGVVEYATKALGMSSGWIHSHIARLGIDLSHFRPGPWRSYQELRLAKRLKEETKAMLKRKHGNIKITARCLGIKPATVYRRCYDYGITPALYRKVLGPDGKVINDERLVWMATALRNERIKRGLSQVALGKVLARSGGYISKVERGQALPNAKYVRTLGLGG